MRILVLSNYANGLYLFRRELIEQFMNDGHEVFVSVPPDENCDKLRSIGWNIYETELSRHGMNPFKDYKLYKAYKKLIRQLKADVVLTYTIKPNIYGAMAARVCKVPYICNITGLGKAIENGGLISKVLIMMYRTSMKKAKRVFFQNEKNMAILQKHGIALHNAGLLPGSGVNLTEHPFREYPSEEDGIRFLAVLRVMRDKGIEEYLQAAKDISARHQEVHFELVGEYEEDERDKYEPLIKELEEKGLLKYYGHIDNVEEVMSKSHVVVHPSYHEGMSNVILEAAACGRPILASNISGCKEAVDEGKSGFLFEPGSAAELEKEIEHILTLNGKERENMGQAARTLIEQKFDRRSIILTYIDEIKDITK
jgi:galacturonosyltransferase